MEQGSLTQEVLDAFQRTPDPRLREILSALLRHLHAFVLDTNLTEEEWLRGIQFLTDSGAACVGPRNEFILLSDVLGVSSLVDELNHRRSAGATESTILGPFYVSDPPVRKFGASITRPDEPGDPAIVSGTIASPDGRPIAAARVDVWQVGLNGLYDVNDPDAPKGNLRARFFTGDNGRYEFRTIRPVDYPIPYDGPGGVLLRATDRHHFRAAHIHFMVTADGHEPIVTHLFDANGEHLDSDVVFGVKPSLLRKFVPTSDGEGPIFKAQFDIVLQPDRRSV
jgi:catechol 1,2-dioxygenase